jgi:hypothetical protein
LGKISAKKRMPTVRPQAKINKLLPSPPKDFSAKPPTKVAPSVFAIVFRLRIAELVSSISDLNFSSIIPLLDEVFLRFSISAEVTLRIIASRVEQSAEIPIVRLIAITKSTVIALY